MLELTNPNAVLMGKESYNLSEMTNRMLTQKEEDDEDDDTVSSEEGEPGGPSPSKSARIIPNPEEINLEVDDDDGEYEAKLTNEVYGVPTAGIPSNENEYNPEPFVKNPEVIDIDNIDDEEDKEGEGEGGELEAYEPCAVSGCEIDPAVTYDPRPVDGGVETQSKEY